MKLEHPITTFVSVMMTPQLSAKWDIPLVIIDIFLDYDYLVTTGYIQTLLVSYVLYLHTDVH